MFFFGFSPCLFLVELDLLILELDRSCELSDFAFLLRFLQFELLFLLAHFLNLFLQGGDSGLDNLCTLLCLSTQLVLHFHQLQLILASEGVLLSAEVTCLVKDHAIVMVADLAHQLV